MVSIAKVFDDEELKSGSAFLVKDGWHKCYLTGSRLEDSFKGEEYPKDLILSGVVTAGDDKHTEFDIRLSVNDNTPIPNGKNGVTWQKMAHKNLMQISKAVGLQTIPYAKIKTLLKKPIMIEFKSRPVR